MHESLGIPEPLGHVVEALRAKELAHRKPLGPANLPARPAEIREAGQDKAVHLAKRPGVKGLELACEVPEEVLLVPVVGESHGPYFLRGR